MIIFLQITQYYNNSNQSINIYITILLCIELPYSVSDSLLIILLFVKITKTKLVIINIECVQILVQNLLGNTSDVVALE